MNGYGYLGFFTAEEARERASAMHERCRAASLRSSRTLNFSHGTRLELGGMTASLNYNSRYRSDNLHVTVNAKNQLSRLLGVQHHYWPHPMDGSMIDDRIAAVSVEQALCQIAQYVDLESMVVALDWATCRNSAVRLTTKDHLHQYCTDIGRFQGKRLFLKALELSRENTDSPQETLLRLESHRRGLPHLEVNHPIVLPMSGRTIHVDLAYPNDHIVLEYDGVYHYDRGRWEADIEKRNELAYAGWRTFPATRATFTSQHSMDRYFSIVGAAIAEYRNQQGAL